MTIKLANNVSGFLNTAITASDTGIVLQSGNGASFPALGAGEYFYATLVSTGGTLEVVKVTARSGDSMTVVRAQDGTSAASFAAGSRLEMRINAQAVLDVVDQVTASQVGFTPVGGIAATDVQAALAELDSEAAKLTTLAASGGSALVGFLQAGTGAQARTVQAKLRETVSVKDFGAVGDGVTDDTVAIQAALTYCGANNKTLYFPDGTYAVNTFGVTMDGATLCAFRVTDDLSLIGPGVITSSTGAVSNSIFGIDATSGTVSLSIDGLGFAGNVRYRAVYAETGATMDTVDIRNVVTARQSLIFGCTVIRSIRVSDNKIGNEIEAATAISPTLTVDLPENPTYNPECAIERNVVRSGTETLSTGAFVIHGLPMGGRCNYNTHLNLSGSATEGFDIDGVGRFAQIIGNSCYGSGFEYKVGNAGYSDSRDIIFANNISTDAPTPFNIRSSCIGYGNIAYNPQNYGLFCTPGPDVDSLLDDATFQLHGFRIIYAGGTPWTAAVKIDGGMAGMEFDGIRIELDPAWKTANPSGTLPNIQFNIDGDINNLTIRNCFIDKSAGDQINVRPTTRISNLNIENVQFGDAGDSCIDLLNCDAVRIINPVFPATITDRPVRLTTCDRVRIECDYHALITTAQTTGTNTGVLINNYGQEAAGAATPPDATARWPVGCVVLNTDDSSVWLRVATSTTPAIAWKQIA